MKKSETQVSHGEPAKSEQSCGDMLDAPVRLTPEQLESVAAGFMAQVSLGGIKISTATTGLFPVPPRPPIKLF